jgi:tripeptide aminopeptidase
MPESPLDRFLRYVQIDTQSAEGQPQVPSTPGQWDLARLLARELETIGAADVRVSEFCTVYARLPGSAPREWQVPVLGFVSHVDTSPAVSGRHVKPVVHRNYQGGDIVLPGDPAQVIRAAAHPVLASMIGDDIVTSDGRTLLGSDDKAGVAAIMTMAEALVGRHDLVRGDVVVAFTPDEEIGVGIEKFDVEGFGARFAYTVDGDMLGEISNETWSARLATVVFHGRSTHPGTAKGVMVNAIDAAAEFVTALPRGMRPETTEGREGFVHPYIGTLDVEASSVKVLLRHFDLAGLDAEERLVREAAAGAAAAHPGVRADVDVKDQYRNMNEVLRDYPQLVDNAFEAARRAGVTPFLKAIRGGTDGSKLTFKGLPCPNIFTGGQNFHSKIEFNSRRSLEKTAETLVHLVQIFAERASAKRE